MGFWGQTSPGTAASVATSQQFPSTALVPQSMASYAALQPQAVSPWQTPGNYRPVLQSGAPLGGRFDQYSPVSNVPASTSAQDAPGTFGPVQSQSSQALGTSGPQDFTVDSSLNQPTFEQEPSSGSTAAISPSSYSASGSSTSSSYSFAQRLNEPYVYKPGPQRSPDQFSSVKH